MCAAHPGARPSSTRSRNDCPAVSAEAATAAQFRIEMQKRNWIGATVLGLMFSGCAALRPPALKSGESLTHTLLVLDEAVESIARPSSEPRAIAEHALRVLHAEAGDNVQRRIRETLLRFPAENTEFHCGAEFLRSRTLQEFARIRDMLLSVPGEAIEPEACYSVPFVIDLTRGSAPQGSLELYGYDFDRVPLELVLVHDGGFTNVTSAMTIKNHNHLTIKLGSDGVQFSEDSEMLGLVWGHVIHYAIPVLQASTPLCASRLEHVPPDLTVRYSPPRNAALVSGNRATVHTSLALESTSNALNVVLCATLKSGSAGGAVFSGCGTEQLFLTEADWRIEQVIGGTRSRLSSHQIPSATPFIRNGSSDGPVAQWTITGIRDAADSGEPQVTGQLTDIVVVSTPVSGCLSIIDYLEARRADRLSLETIQRLDAQLAAVDPAILKLRPRFAPPARRSR